MIPATSRRIFFLSSAAAADTVKTGKILRTHIVRQLRCVCVHFVRIYYYYYYVTLYYYNTTYTGRTTMLFIKRFGRFRKNN